MALRIETFSNVAGGYALFKALGHPAAAPSARALLADLAAAGPIAVYDPLAQAGSFAELHPLADVEVTEVYAQDRAALGTELFGCEARPITELAASRARALLVAAFDAERLLDQVRHLLPNDVAVHSFDRMRLGDDMLTNPRRYLDPLNFATNFALLREGDGHHTRLVTANYWHGYGARGVALWLCLLDEHGAPLAEWREPLPDAPAPVIVDSREVAARFGLGAFTGSLVLHAIGVAGHDVVKYALDTYGDDPSVLSCTHDANAWPAELYAGLPAPAPGERVRLWVQNSHPCPIPAGAVGMRRMGEEDVAWYAEAIPPFGCRAIEVGDLLPDVRWPEQVEVQAGKHFVRPRYEVLGAGGRARMAHANVERVDLEPDPELPALGPMFGKGFLLPAPVLPVARFSSELLPTPMATGQRELPTQVVVYDAEGAQIARRSLGRLARGHATAVAIDDLLDDAAGEGFSHGHLELLYDFADGGEGDGWLHALFRYRDRRTGHAAESSFGSHIFNTAMVHRDEPQSYASRPPGLSTRLFLRLGPPGADTLCHLIYAASAPWHARSDTQLALVAADGEQVAARHLEIPCGGSALWRYHETFDASERAAAGEHAYVLVRDTTCRLFGYHGLDTGDAFSLDHMFGF